MNKYILHFILIISVLSFVDACQNDPETISKNEFLEASTDRDPNTRLTKLEAIFNKSDKSKRYMIMPMLAKSAYEVGKIEKANLYATKLLELSDKCTSNWNYGNAIHDGHMVLGRIAIYNSKIELAKKHLILAGKTPGSPQLNSFGPNMNLAKDLLEKGEKEVVIQYFELCKVFWKSEDGRLDSWIAAIKGGGMPYLRPNLYR